MKEMEKGCKNERRERETHLVAAFYTDASLMCKPNNTSLRLELKVLSACKGGDTASPIGVSKVILAVEGLRGVTSGFCTAWLRPILT